MYDNILAKLNEYDNITIFRHVRPDGDAMFSAMGLAQFIEDNFPDKTVKLAGYETFDLISRNDDVSDEYIKNSLVFVLDTANKERCDDERFKYGSYIIKIDHHPAFDQYGNDNYVDPKASSACEVVARILLSKLFKQYKLSKRTCEYLYCGMVTDSINFRVPTTTYKTLNIASKLVKAGDLIVGDLVSFVSDTDRKTFELITKIRTKLKFKDKFGYVVLSQDELKELGVSSHEAKIHVNQLTTISDINIYALVVEDETGLYDASYRSKREFIINDVARDFGGGGHANACATRNLTYEDQLKVFDILIERSTK